MNRLVFFSGGKGSFVVSAWLKENYPNDNILLYFTDTKWEDEDLYRFINEVSDKLELPLLTHSLGINPIQLMYQQKVLFNSRIGNCSKYLKMDVAAMYLKKDIEPPIVDWYNKQYLKDEDFKTNAILYFGIDYMENHRVEPIKRNWKPYEVEFPLVEMYLDPDDYFEKYQICNPRLYQYGFSHNNCKGRCVKAGQGHFKNLRDMMPDVFKTLMEQEHHMKNYVSAYHYINRWEGEDEAKAIYLKELDKAYSDYFNGKVNKPSIYIPPNLYNKKYSFMKKQGEPYQLRDLELDNRNQVQFDLFDIGGCGCFVDYEE